MILLFYSVLLIKTRSDLENYNEHNLRSSTFGIGGTYYFSCIILYPPASNLVDI